MSYIIFTDGSSRNNPGKSGWGAIICNMDTNIVQETGGYEEQSTNNRMELTAIIKSLDYVKVPSHITIYSDSSYVIQGITTWIHTWKNNNWTTSTKKAVLNSELWIRLDQLSNIHTITYRHVRGHQGNFLNERADTIATAFADQTPISLLNSAIPLHYKVHLDSLESENNSQGESKIKNKKVFGYVSCIDSQYEFHADWKSCKQRIYKKKARFKKVYNQTECDEFKTSCSKTVV